LRPGGEIDEGEKSKKGAERVQEHRGGEIKKLKRGRRAEIWRVGSTTRSQKELEEGFISESVQRGIKTARAGGGSRS